MSERTRVEMLLDLRRYDEAVEAAGRAAAEDPSDAGLQCLLAKALLSAGDKAGAQAAAERAILLQPDRAYAHHLRSIALLNQRHNRDALREAELAASLDPESPAMQLALTQALLANHRVRRARHVAHLCRTLDPHGTTGLRAEIAVAIHRQRWKEAEAACLQVLAIDPEDRATRHNLGITLSHRVGRRREALGHLAEASKLDPSRSESRRAYDRLKSGLTGTLAAIIVGNAIIGAQSGDTKDTFLDALAAVTVLGALAVFGFPVLDRLVRAARRLPPPPSVPRDPVTLRTVGQAVVVLAALGWLVVRVHASTEPDTSAPASDPQTACVDQIALASGAGVHLRGSPMIASTWFRTTADSGGRRWQCIAVELDGQWRATAGPL